MSDSELIQAELLVVLKFKTYLPTYLFFLSNFPDFIVLLVRKSKLKT